MLEAGNEGAVDFVDYVCKAFDSTMLKTMAGYPTRQSVEDMGDVIENIFLTS